MSLPLYVVDAFTSAAFSGNPAAVVVLDEARDDARDDPWMSRVAAEMKHSETAFVSPGDNGTFGLRWFTPEVEVDLCGHATLAAAHVLWESGRLDVNQEARFDTRSGILGATRDVDGIRLDFPIVEPVPERRIAGLFDSLGLPECDVYRAGDFYVLVEAPDALTVQKLAPDFDKLRQLSDVRAVIVTSRADDGVHSIVSRVFGPRVGIDEDPVTGSAHCVLAAYWCPRLETAELFAVQASRRGGELRVRRVGDRAHLLGRAVTVARGELLH
jgi:PhzF family phenazine biosynthesis protein